MQDCCVLYLPTWCISTACTLRDRKACWADMSQDLQEGLSVISRAHKCTLYECRCPLRAGKTRRELVELERSIDEQLDSGVVPDPEYWTTVLGRLSIWQVPTRPNPPTTSCCFASAHNEAAAVGIGKHRR